MRGPTAWLAAACVTLALGCLAASAPAPGGPSRVAILCYHDLSEEPVASPLVVAPQVLRDQIRSAKASGWTFLTLAEVLARAGRGEELPPKVMVLTFDDGYRSFLKYALPILREEAVPATLAVISAFVDNPPPDLPPLLTWKQIQQIEASGSVEIASHTHDLHRWVTSNPYRDTAPAIATRSYLLAQARYENRDEYRERLRADLTQARKTLRAKLGHDVAVLVWPYGEHNEMARAQAAAAGFRAGLALGDREASPEDFKLGLLPRILVTRDTPRSLAGLAWSGPPPRPARAARVDLDSIFDPDPQRFRDNVDRTIALVRQAGANLVVLQACADPRGDGMLREAYFMNHQLPVKADIWSMVAAKLHHAGLKVWVRAPTLNLSWLWERHPEWQIPRAATSERSESGYFRISPDVPEARTAASDLYGDIAVYLPIDGVLFDDDLYMLPEEQLRASGVADPGAKAEAMRALTAEIMRTVRAWRPDAKFGRVIYASAAGHAGVDPGTAQDLGLFLRYYDLTVVTASARAKARGDDAPSIRKLARAALSRWTQDGPAPLLFMLDPRERAEGGWRESADLLTQCRTARQSGILQLGIPVSPAAPPLPDGLLGEGLVSSVPPPTGSRRSSRSK